MRKWINLMEGLSDMAVEKTAISLKTAIENKLETDKSIGTNPAIYSKMITRPDYIADPSEEVQKLAVQEYGWAIKYIDNPSEEIQKLAVQQYGPAIRLIKNPSEEMKRLAARN